MSVRYRLSCACGKSLSVGDAQAGSSLTCACGATVAVPQLRELRKLPRDETPQAAAPPARPWNPRQAALFVCGMCTIGALVVSGILLLGRAGLDVRWDPQEQRRVDDEFIDSLEPFETIGAFYEMRIAGLGEQRPTPQMRSVQSHKNLTDSLHWALIASGVGAALWIVAALAIPRPATKP